MPTPSSTLDASAPERVVPSVAPALRASRRPALRDPRLIIGAVLVIAAAGLGAWGWSSGQRTIAVWAVVGDLPAGATLDPADVEVRMIPPEWGAVYLAATDDPVGREVVREVGAGELLPADALGEPGTRDVREVTVPVEAARAPMGLARGARVDVYATADRGATALVLPDAVVGAVQQDGARFAGAGRTWSVVLVVPAERVGQLVAGARRGQLDLVERTR
jgi:hypothetical protein